MTPLLIPNARHGGMLFSVFLAGSCFCLGLVFSCHAHIPVIWNEDDYFVPLDFESMLFLGGGRDIQLGDFLNLARDFEQ